MNNLFSKFKTHIFIILAIVAISAAYVPEAIKGNALPQSDIMQYKGAAREYFNYQKQGERILWTNTQFGGMPTYQITGVGLENPIQYLRIPKGPLVWEKIFLMLLCSYLMFVAFKVRPWLSLVGAVAMTFVTGNMLVIEAGHNTQALAIAYLPLVIAGVKYLLRGKWLLGANLVTIGMALELVVNHLQITYYGGMVIAFWMVAEAIIAIKNKGIPSYLKASVIAIACVVVAFGANALNIMLTQEYVKHTIRGKSELSINKDGSPLEAAPSDGLDYDYAFQWSNGWGDVGAMFIPNWVGGGANTNLYFGDLPFTSGPQYMGITILFLAVFAFFILDNRYKWWLLAAILFGIVISLGKNHFTGINGFLFEHLPLYNKFRAPTMALTIVQWCLPILAILGLNKALDEEQDKMVLLKKLKQVGIGLGAVLLAFTLFTGMFNDYRTTVKIDPASQIAYDADSRIIEDNKLSPETAQRVLFSPREDLVKKDAQRSLIFFALAFAILFFTLRSKLQTKWSLILMGLLIVFDLWGVDKRYLNDDNFQPKRAVKNMIRPTNADQQIMADKEYYRVLDITSDPLRNARASYFHNSIGGYSAAKLGRYQEFFDWHIKRDFETSNFFESPYLNMLNMRYLIYQVDKDKAPMPAYNANALGAAWFVQDIKEVANANECILAMTEIAPEKEAIIEAKDADKVKVRTYAPDSNATVELTSYHPEHMKYVSSSANDGFIVFSEIYYQDGWNAYIDNKPVPHAQVNYILRGLEVPAGEHSIEFKFEPVTYSKGKAISLASNAIIYILLLASLGLGLRNELKG